MEEYDDGMATLRFKKAKGYFEHVAKEKQPSKEATVLLIGSTGNGKSTLGNYLLAMGANDKSERFATAKDNKPQTQNVQSDELAITDPALKYSSVHITVIDTPGLNESDVEDLKHMIGIIEELEKRGEIGACILVVKFNAKIDAQYKKTIEYYSQLLPSLFEKNVFVVMTDFATDHRTVAIRERDGIDVDRISENAAKEIIRSSNMKYDDLMVFKIDCLPFDAQEKAYSEDVRNTIVEYVAQLQPIKLEELMVAKTTYVTQIDNEQIKKHEGEINGYKQRLIDINRESAVALNTIQEKESIVANLQSKIDLIERQLKEKDTHQLVTAASWSIDAEWKFCKTQKHGCELKSEWRIANVKTWTNDRCKWSDVWVTKHTFKGKVKGRFSRGLYANVILEVEKRTKYATEIHELRNQLEAATYEHQSEEEVLCKYREKHSLYKNEITELEAFIQDKKARIKELKAPSMTISEARERLNNIIADIPK